MMRSYEAEASSFLRQRHIDCFERTAEGASS